MTKPSAPAPSPTQTSARAPGGSASPGPIIQTARLDLRVPQLDDFSAWDAFYRSKRGAYVGGGPETTLGASWRVFASVAGHWSLRGYGLFTVVERATGEPIGSIGPWFPADWPEAEIAWSIWPESAEGAGYATEAARAALDYAFTHLGWTTAVSYIDHDNKRSQRLAERLGARVDDDAPTLHGESMRVYRHRGG